MARGNKIERLPDHLRENLREMLATKQHTCQQIADAINEELAALSGVQTDVESIDDNTVWREKNALRALQTKYAAAKPMLSRYLNNVI